MNSTVNVGQTIDSVPMRISSVRFRNFKALKDYSAALSHMNIFVGPNNSGKSTLLSAFRALAVAVQHARVRSPTHLGSYGWGYRLNPETLPLTLENIHTDYNDVESTVEFSTTDGSVLKLAFPKDGGCVFLVKNSGAEVKSPKSFKARFPIEIATVPVLGPVEHDEHLMDEDYVRRNLNTHRASRHFRNFWRHNSVAFPAFRATLTSTWPGMSAAGNIRGNPCVKA